MDWARGLLPNDLARLYEFLKLFPREEALECLRAGDLPIPSEWAVPEEPDDLIRKYVQRCRGVIDRPHMEASIRKILDEELKEPEGYEPEP